MTVTKKAKNGKSTKIELMTNNSTETLKSGKMLKDRVKVMQAEVMMISDMKVFRKGQTFSL